LKSGDLVGEHPDPNATHHSNELSALNAAAAARRINLNAEVEAAEASTVLEALRPYLGLVDGAIQRRAFERRAEEPSVPGWGGRGQLDVDDGNSGG
jgi:hypothetical protein